VLVQVSALDQLETQGRVDRDSRRGNKIERLKHISRSDEREVMLDRRRPYVRAVGHKRVHAHDAGNEWLPPL
jgi:hypothetical protein